MAAVDCIGDTSSKVHVIVLEQNHIEKSDTMVHATADLHGLLFEHTHTGRGLAGIEHAGLGAFQTLHITVGHRGDAAHTLHDVKHQALCLKQRTYTSGNNHGDVTFLHTRTISHQYLHLHIRVEAMEHLLSHFHTGQNTIFLDQQMALAHSILGDAAKRSVVAISDIFGKRQINQSVY